MRKLLFLALIGSVFVVGCSAYAQAEHEQHQHTCEEVATPCTRYSGNMFDPARDLRDVPAGAVFEVRITSMGDDSIGKDLEVLGSLAQSLCSNDGAIVAPAGTVVWIQLTPTGENEYRFHTLQLHAGRRSYLLTTSSLQSVSLQSVATIPLGNGSTNLPHRKGSQPLLAPGSLLRFSVTRTVSPTISIN